MYTFDIFEGFLILKELGKLGKPLPNLPAQVEFQKKPIRSDYYCTNLISKLHEHPTSHLNYVRGAWSFSVF